MSKNNKKNITFFTPSLQKTGSEIVLFNLLPFIAKFYNVTVITKYKGVLYEKLPTEVQKIYLYKKPLSQSFFSRAIHKIRREFVVPKILESHKNSFWYLNTIMLPDILDYAKTNNVSICVHVHELEQMYSSITKEQVKNLTSFPKFIIANSMASKSVIEQFGCKLPVEIIYPALQTTLIKSDETRKSIYREKLQIKSADFLWVMSGTLDENKNPFLFVEIAEKLKQSTTNFKMMWIGASPNTNLYFEECKKYANKLGVGDCIIWAGDVKGDYYNYLNCADGFVLTSKKESFSLVTLEALLLGLPVVAANCDGVKEILKNDIGKIVETPINAEKMAGEMMSYMKGGYQVDVGAGKLRAAEFDIKIWGEKWSKILNEYFAKDL